ncbi:TPA: hemagglutinin [Photobacterium damselae]
MPSELSAQCPCCKKTAEGDLNQIEELFGFRNMTNGKKIAQSYCRVCRSKKCGSGQKNC